MAKNLIIILFGVKYKYTGGMAYEINYCYRNSDDSSSVQAALTEEGYFVTKLSTTGGFLKKGNTTFFIGTNDDKVEHAVGIIKENSKKRVEKEPTVPPTEMGEFFTPIMVDVLVGGATVFVLDIEQFEKF